MTSERLSNIDLFSIEGVRSEKIDLDNIVYEFDNRHDNRRIKIHWIDVDMKFCRRLCRDLYENHIVYCLFVWIFFLVYLK